MSKIDDGGPAFPYDERFINGEYQPGMTKRDWFAGQALPAIIRQCAIDLVHGNPDKLEPEEYFARKAYAVADAMLIASRQNGDPT